MSTITEDQTTQNQAASCQCKEQIADILTRLETLERDALTLQKLKEIEPANIAGRIMDSMNSRSR